MALSPTLSSQGCLLLLSVNHWLLIQETEKKMTQKKKINPLCMRFRPGQSRQRILSPFFLVAVEVVWLSRMVRGGGSGRESSPNSGVSNRAELPSIRRHHPFIRFRTPNISETPSTPTFQRYTICR